MMANNVNIYPYLADTEEIICARCSDNSIVGKLMQGLGLHKDD